MLRWQQNRKRETKGRRAIDVFVSACLAFARIVQSTALVGTGPADD